jgi:hypothetical protein
MAALDSRHSSSRTSWFPTRASNASRRASRSRRSRCSETSEMTAGASPPATWAASASSSGRCSRPSRASHDTWRATPSTSPRSSRASVASVRFRSSVRSFRCFSQTRASRSLRMSTVMASCSLGDPAPEPGEIFGANMLVLVMTHAPFPTSRRNLAGAMPHRGFPSAPKTREACVPAAPKRTSCAFSLARTSQPAARPMQRGTRAPMFSGSVSLPRGLP